MIVEDLQQTMNAFAEIRSIEHCYGEVLMHSRLMQPASFMLGLQDKLKNTVRTVGFAVLANGLIERSWKLHTTSKVSSSSPSPPSPPLAASYSSSASSTTSGAVHAKGTSGASIAPPRGLKDALRRYILYPANRLAKPSRNMRKLLKEICAHASADNVALLEGLWREVVSDAVLDLCTQRYSPVASAAASASTSTLTGVGFNGIGAGAVSAYRQEAAVAEACSNELLDALIYTLRDVRHISRMDLAATHQSVMSADLAFLAGFRRLPKEHALEITKILAVRISSLIDSFKSQPTAKGWSKAIEETTDLIQVRIIEIIYICAFVYNCAILLISWWFRR